MPLPKGFKNVSIRPQVMEKLKEKWERDKKRSPNVPEKLATYINELLLELMEKERFLQEWAPYLSEVGIQDDILFVKDSRLGKTVEIQVKDGRLICNEDKSDNCIHVHFALALPKVARLNLKKPTPSSKR